MSPEARGLLWMVVLFVVAVLSCCAGLALVEHHPLWLVRW